MSTVLDPNDVLIRTLPTPNPYAMKFVLNVSLKNEGKATFNTPEEAENLPLVRDMFAIDGVRQVYLFQNTMTITHNGEIDNDILAVEAESVIRSRYSVHNPAFGEAAAVAKPRPHNDNPLIQQIEEILDRTVRPGLQADGGDIEILGLENHELRILYQGACGGCPSSMMGTLDAIQGILRNELGDEQLTVVPA